MSQSMGSCPVCNKSLNSGGDVVTCPECGAPYHRACYMQTGHCLYQDRHGHGFEYKSPGQEKAEAAGQEPTKADSGMLCRNCQTINDARNIFCERCGAPLHSPGPAQPGPGGAPGPGQPGVWPPQGGMGPGGYWGQAGYGPGVDTSGEIDGIPKKDWAEFVGSSAPVYLPRLSQMARRDSKISFMFSAFFLGPFYFAYRKMWGWAALALAVSLVLQVPYFLWIMTEFNLPPVPAAWGETLDVLSNVCSFVSIAVNLLTGTFALQLFRMHAGKRMKALRQQHELEADYHAALAAGGGVSVAGVLIVLGLNFVAALVLYQFAGDAMLQIMNAYLASFGMQV